MDTNCLMWYMHTAITLNGDCKMKHYVSQQKGKCKLILLLFRCKCLSRLVGIQGLWHQNNLFYYYTRTTGRVLGAGCLGDSDGQMKFYSYSFRHAISFQHISHSAWWGTWLQTQTPFKDEMLGFPLNTVRLPSFTGLPSQSVHFSLQGFAAACQTKGLQRFLSQAPGHHQDIHSAVILGLGLPWTAEVRA